MNIDECYQLGHVIKTHGLKGEVNIFLDVDHPSEYQELGSVFVEINQKLVPFFIESMQLKGNKALVKFEDVDSLEQAEELSSKRIYMPLASLPTLDDDQFYYHEIIGYQVKEVHAGELGVVKNVYTSGAQDLVAMEYRGKEILIPVADEILVKIDRDQQLLEVAIPDGLLEIYLDE